MTDQELNAAVAEKLGLKTVLDKYAFPKGAIPDYCHSIAAAWEIVEFMHQEYKVYIVSSEVITNGWCCELTYGAGNIQPQHAVTAPRAICKAFLSSGE